MTNPTTSCGAGLYWDSSTNSCKSMQSACADAHGTWDSAANYCRMSMGNPDPKAFAFACPEGNEWNGSYCTPAKRSSVDSMVASVVSAFASLFGF